MTKELLKSILGGPVGISGGSQFYFTCPVCNKQKHAYINFKTFLWDCKKCGTTGNLYSLLKFTNNLDLLEGERIDVQAPIKKLLSEGNESKHKLLELKKIRLPVGFKKLHYTSDNIFASYLKKRKFTNFDFQLYEPGFTELIERYRNYVIISIFQNFSVRGFIGRYVGTDENKRRYENSKNTDFSKLLGGFDEIDGNTSTVILVEGIFDKISVTNELCLFDNEKMKCLCTWGKKVSDYQIQLLKNRNIKNICLFWDSRDAVKEIKNYGIKLSKYFAVTACLSESVLDPAEMDAKQLLAILQAAEPIENYAHNYVQINALR